MREKPEQQGFQDLCVHSRLKNRESAPEGGSPGFEVLRLFMLGYLMLKSVSIVMDALSYAEILLSLWVCVGRRGRPV